MTRNNLFYKVLFAIEIALLPMVAFAHLFIADWSAGLFIAGILICKIWREIFKNRDDKGENIIGCIASIIVFSTLIGFFIYLGLINTALAIVALVLIILMNLFNIITFGKHINNTISAVDSCFMISECLTIASFIFVSVYDLISSIALFTVILTSVVSVVYKAYYVVKYTDLISKIKNKLHIGRK